MTPSLLPRLFFFIPFLLAAAAGSLPSRNPDLLPLLAFKLSLSSPASAVHVLSSWDPAVDPCSSWHGVYCRRGRVARLVLEGSDLDGPIHHLARLPHLGFLSLSNNSFSFPLHQLDLSLSPWQAHLKILHLSHNRFSGPFPTAFLSLRRLRRLDLAGNLISGFIPPEIGVFLRHLLTLRLEENNLSGNIPASVGFIPELTVLNVSHNRLAGEIPGKLSYFPPSSFVANPGLCGVPLPHKCPNDLAASSADPRPPPSTQGRKMWKWTVVIAAAAAAITASIAATVVALFRFRKWARRKGETTTKVDGEDQEEKEEDERGSLGRMEWFDEGRCTAFALEDLMRGSAEMLGRGAVGSTYRVVMEGGGGGGGGGEETVAVVVKRVRRKTTKEKKGIKEEERLLKEMGRWRHTNVVSLRAYHYSSSGEELLLVYDFLPNGSLSNLLHGNRGPGRIPLEWTSRLKLALGAAKGLAYLHSASNSMLSHQHLTSSNILIDDDGNACVSDFALLELLSPLPSPSSFNSTSSHTAATEATRRAGSDVYSFGIILLEMLTGRPAVGEEDLAKWVQTVVRQEWTSEVFDIELMRGKAAEDEMFALLQVALLCVAQEAKDRPRMGVVHKMIEDIRDRGNRRSGGSISPSLNDHSYDDGSSPCLSEDTPTITSCSR
ncbi:hypothetical protein Cni_G29212 [Canna indica]|uniref:Protein kinase domain-containing protein n=1 Tax=Canna indica TaxID=4628 RepID=A0AAQ3L6U2_9LILI|nr:hypothetical protein Cni_G29212 [Canna indica]